MKKFSFQQQVLTGFAFTLLFVFTLAVVSYLSIRGRIKDLQEDQAWVNYTRDIVDDNNHVLEYLTDAETGERGYILTGDSRFLQPYTTSVGNVNNTVTTLSNRMLNPPIADTLSRYVKLLLGDMDETLVVYRVKGKAAAEEYIRTGNGKFYMDKVREITRQIRKDKNAEIMQRVENNKSSTSSDRTLIIILTGSAILLGLVLVLLFYIIRTFKQQKVIEDNVRHTNLQLEQVSEENKRRNWLLTGTSTLEKSMRGGQDVKELATNIMTELARYTNARIGAFYLLGDDKKSLEIVGSYAYDFTQADRRKVKVGEGLAGQTAADRRQLIFEQVPEDYIRVGSATGHTLPDTLLFQPFFHDDELKGVIELGYTGEISEVTLHFISIVIDSIGIAIDTAQARVKLQLLFGKTQQQAEELESQQEELRTTNEELVRKTEALQASEEELHVQQEELRQINSELQEKAEQLEERNRVVDQAREAISAKAEELEQISKYKSEFLANMSHELRTPLNSILILARILKENKAANLNEEQVKYASVIHNAGTDLLTLINDILDLSKIESGKIDLTIEDVDLLDVKRDLELLFKEVAGNKKIAYEIQLTSGLPRHMISDRVRLEQILRNLLSNAFKFTPEKGSVTVEIGAAKKDSAFFFNEKLRTDEPVLYFSVKDTGIGIPKDKQKAIFEAFQQADGSTSRKYGGTGLGLSISRELANILGGQIDLRSMPGEGSTFTLYLPLNYAEQAPAPGEEKAEPVKPALTDLNDSEDQQRNEEPADPADHDEHRLLIIEDDMLFADVLKDYAVERGFQVSIAYQGDTGLETARKTLPHAIVLDVMLPVMDGWEVLRNLKADEATRDIPVHMMSAGDERPAEARKLGAIGFLKKPVVKEKLDEAFDLLSGSENLVLNKVLIIEDHEIQSENLKNRLKDGDIDVRQAFDGAQALSILAAEPNFDCIILDLRLPDISGLDLLDKIKEDERVAHVPVVINTAMELTQEDVARVMKHTHAMVLKNNKSNERLIDEVNLFMNKIKDDNKTAAPALGTLPGTPKNTATLEKALSGKHVLIVDDDMRNVFAITSALQPYQLEIQIANDGKEALAKLDADPETDLVLMDIMMPEMDGYEAMREIRKQKRFTRLPILALTAKAMKSDRDKCIEAGANDYISKPVDIDKLLSLMRVWIS